MAEQKKQHSVDQSNNNSGKNKGLSTKQKIFIGLSFLTFAAIIGVLLFLLLYEPPEREPISVVTKDNIGEIGKDLVKKVEEGMFEIKMNTEWEFETATSPSTNAYIANAESNNGPFYFDVVLTETEEKVYTSPHLPLGTRINDLVLEKELLAGAHNAMVVYNLLDEAGKVKNSVSVAITLTILN